MASPGTGRLAALATSPAAPAPGYLLLYFKTDGTLYIKDSANLETPIGTASGITGLVGEATGTGPGNATVTLSNSAVIGKILTGFTPGPNSTVLATDTILQAVQKLQSQVSSVAGTNLLGDVTGTLGATVVSFVGGESAADIAQSVTDTQAATPTNTASTIVKRNASGNFSANEITADLIGNADTATNTSNVGSKTATEVVQSVDDTQDATSINTASTLVKRDASGNFAANIITANLTGTASGNEPPIIATTAADYYRGDKTFQPLNKAAVGLGNVDNTSDVNKPVSTAQAAADAAVQAFSIQRANHTGTQLASTISDFAEAAQDAVGNIFTNTANIDFTYDDAGNQVSADLTDTLVAPDTYGAADRVGTFNVDQKGRLTSAVNVVINITKSQVSDFSHASTHLPSGSDPLTTATAVGLDASSTNTEGNAESFARSNHTHDLATGIVSTQIPDQTNAEGTSANLARADHVHNIPSGTPVQIGTSNFAGAASSFALSDHVHAHGNQTSGTLHAEATTSVNGFMSAADKTKLDVATNLNTPSTLVLRDASGNFSANVITADLTGNVTGDLTGNVTGNVSGSAASFTGPLVGDVTGTQGATVVDLVGGKTATQVSTSVDDTLAATNANNPSTIVKRDVNGDISIRDLSARRISQSGGYYSSVVALSDGPTINTDAFLGNIFTVTIAGNRTFAAPTNSKADQKITYKIRQDAVGGRIISWNAAFNFGVDLSGVPNSTSPNVFDYYGFQYDESTLTWHCLAISRGY